MNATGQRIAKPLPSWSMPIHKDEREACDICKESAIARVVASDAPYPVCATHLEVEAVARDGTRLSAPLAAPQTALRECANCRRKMTYITQGECGACYKYRKSHGGQARPEHLYRRERVTGATKCRVCGVPSVDAAGRCQACYRWWKKNGVDRPKERHPKLCKNPACEKPLPKRGNKKTHHSGLCDRCHDHHKKTGKMMTKAQVESSPFCDCGKRAAYMVHLSVGCRLEAFWLCASCYQLEVG